MTGERFSSFLRSMEHGKGEFLEGLERDARERQIPVIREEAQSMLRLLIALTRPSSILEVGTAVGFSALYMASAAPEGCKITTIENYAKRAAEARENFKRAEREGQITLLEGDAADVLRGLDGSFDLIFMDAAKGQYISLLPDVMRLLPVGGVLVSDNVLHGGEVLESRFAVTRRDRTIHKRMREYIYALTHDERLVTSVLSAGDGLTVSLRVAP